MTVEHEWRFGPLIVDATRVDNISQSEGVNSTENDVLESNSAVEPQSDQTVSLEGTRVTFKGEHASMHAREFSEFLRTAVMQPFAISPAAAEGAGLGGYFVAGNITREPTLSPPGGSHSTSVERVSARDLARAGTRKSVWIAVDTHPTQPDPGHDFGTNETARIGIPATATNVQAVDAAIGPSQRHTPTPVFTIPSEKGGTDVYDTLDVPFEDPIFLYGLEYDDATLADVSVFDTLGYETKHYVDEWGDQQHRQWQYVFNPAHDLSDGGALVLDNGLLRVYLDDQAGTIAAEGFDDGSYGSGPYGAGPYGGYEDPDGADVWHDISINEGEWTLVDTDLTYISPVRAEAQLEFQHDDGSLYALDVQLDRGMALLRVWIPQSLDGPIPASLADVLDPIASRSTYDPGLRQTLIPREEVRY